MLATVYYRKAPIKYSSVTPLEYFLLKPVIAYMYIIKQFIVHSHKTGSCGFKCCKASNVRKQPIESCNTIIFKLLLVNNMN